jgi:SAM-dependent methyltransferase
MGQNAAFIVSNERPTGVKAPIMTAAVPAEFAYQDKKLGDTETIKVVTSPDVFYPTSTSVLLLRGTRRMLAPEIRSVLDLGCGTGIVAVALAKLLPSGTAVCASDLSPAAVALTRLNAERNGVAVECRCGTLFEPWHGHQFDLIVEDVSGVAEPLAQLSGWYPPAVPSEAGRDGTRWIVEILDRAPDFLSPGGRLVFPLLTLSQEDRVRERACSRFATVEQLEEQWYPLNEELVAHFALVEQLVAEGAVRIEKRGSRWCWGTKIYLARRA